MDSILLLLVIIQRLSTNKFIIFVFQLINFHFRSYLHRNVFPYFWYSHSKSMSAYISSKVIVSKVHWVWGKPCLKSLVFCISLKPIVSWTGSLPFRIFNVWIISPLSLHSSRLVILTWLNFSSYESTLRPDVIRIALFWTTSNIYGFLACTQYSKIGLT